MEITCDEGGLSGNHGLSYLFRGASATTKLPYMVRQGTMHLRRDSHAGSVNLLQINDTPIAVLYIYLDD